jgi:ABC-2 type transport system ATP-binding protein
VSGLAERAIAGGGAVRPSAELAIEIHGLVVRYGHTTAVNDLALRVPRGSVYGLIGPNGAGMTTIMRTLATLQKPDRGTILLDGIDILDNPGAARTRVGYMPDFFGTYDRLTVAEYLEFFGASHGVPGGRRRIVCDELLELFDLEGRRMEPVDTLSRGMKQRLGLARCLIHDPPVLLLDEPAAGVDTRSRIELNEILRELSRLNKTILLSSHVLPELADISTHMGIICAGQIVAEGSVADVMARYASGTRLRIRLLHPDDTDRARDVLAGDSRCDGVEREDELTLLAGFVGAGQDLAELHGHLLGSGLTITHFALVPVTLEDVFLSVTELAEVSA